jgi:hypothetical protein
MSLVSATRPAHRRESSSASAEAPAWWATPWVSVLLSSVGLLIHADVSYLENTKGSASDALYWLSLMLLFVPTAWQVSLRRTSATARTALVVMCGLALYVTRILDYPTVFAYHDELIHQNNLRLIDSSHHLFAANSILPVTSFYPGIEIVANAVQSTTGLSQHISGEIVIALSRVILMLAGILLLSTVLGSERAGCFGMLVYMANPQFLFFNSQFSYQTLALPLAFFCVYLIAHPVRGPFAVGIGAIALGVGALTVAHHLTALAFVGFTAAWLLLTRVGAKRSSADREYSGAPALLPWAVGISTIELIAWSAFTYPRIKPYLVSIATHSWDSVVVLFNGHSQQLFANPVGPPTPVWERATSFASVAAILIALAFSLTALARARFARSAGMFMLAAVAAVYPIIPLGHLTNAASEVADRSSGFLYVGLGAVFVWWFRRFLTSRNLTASNRRLWDFGALIFLALIFLGGTVVGSGPTWLRTPGPYLVSADNRSVDRYNLATAHWMGEALPARAHVFTDRVNGLLDSTYGRATIITHAGSGIDMRYAAGLLLAGPNLPRDTAIINAIGAQYLVVDQRLDESLPGVGEYIEDGEQPVAGKPTPIPSEAALQKFNNYPGVDRIYDNGEDVIYTLGGIR